MKIKSAKIFEPNGNMMEFTSSDIKSVDYQANEYCGNVVEITIFPKTEKEKKFQYRGFPVRIELFK